MGISISAAVGSALPIGSIHTTKTAWHEYDKYDFRYEGRNCQVVVPRIIASGNPWIWRARFFGHEPQTDTALLARGFHLVYMEVLLTIL